MEIIWDEGNGARSIESHNEGEYNSCWEYGILKKGVKSWFIIKDKRYAILKDARIDKNQRWNVK